jgi:predicted HicB family RNase H-like nuclease
MGRPKKSVEAKLARRAVRLAPLMWAQVRAAAAADGVSASAWVAAAIASRIDAIADSQRSV